MLALLLSACSVNDDQRPIASVGPPTGVTTQTEPEANRTERTIAAKAAPTAGIEFAIFAAEPHCCFPASSPEERENYARITGNPVQLADSLALVAGQPDEAPGVGIDPAYTPQVRR